MQLNLFGKPLLSSIATRLMGIPTFAIAGAAIQLESVYRVSYVVSLDPKLKYQICKQQRQMDDGYLNGPCAASKVQLCTCFDHDPALTRPSMFSSSPSP